MEEGFSGSFKTLVRRNTIRGVHIMKFIPDKGNVPLGVKANSLQHVPRG